MVSRKKVLNCVILLAFFMLVVGSVSAATFVQRADGWWVDEDTGIVYSPEEYATLGSPTSSSGSGSRANVNVNTEPLNGSTYDASDFFTKRLRTTPIFGIFLADNISDVSAMTELVKILFLILVVALIYGALSYVDFPTKNTPLRVVISVIVGFLSTMLITTSELLAILESYKALGLSITIFLPLLILAFFTLVVSIKADPFGILAQKILWVVYSAYLMIRTLSLLLIKWLASLGGIPEGGAWDSFFTFILGSNWAQNRGLQGDTTTLIVLAVVSILVWAIFVTGNQALEQWLMKEKRDADMDKYKDDAERQHKARGVDADLTRK